MAKKTKKTSKKTTKTKTAKKNKGGRPTLFKQDYIRQIYLLARQGFTDKQIAEVYGIAESTLNLWKEKHPEFMESLKRGRDEFDTDEVENAFLKRCKGFEYEENHVERDPQGQLKVKKVKRFMPPDPWACFIWLKNRRAGRWKDKQEIAVTEMPKVEIILNQAK